MDLNRLLNSDPELSGMLNNFSSGQNTSNWRDNAPYKGSSDMQSVFSEIDKFSAMSRGERSIFDD